MKFFNKLRALIFSYFNLFLIIINSILTLVSGPIISLYTGINSIIQYILENKDKNDINNTKKSKIYKCFKKTSLFICLTSNITNLYINYDYYTQPIYKKFALQKNPFAKNSNNEKNISNTNEKINEVCANVLMNAIETNPYLKEEEKKYLSPIKQFFLDNEFLDYEKTYQTLNTFYIHDDLITKIKGWLYYNRNTPENIIVSAQTVYNSLADDQKNMNIYNLNLNESDYMHELFHIIGEFDNSFFNEGMVSLLTEEYSFMDDNYLIQRLVTKIIIEIIGADNMLKAYNNNNFEFVKEKLNEVNNDPELTEQFLNCVNKNKFFYSKEDISNILDYINSYKENLDCDTQNEITKYSASLYLYTDLTDNFYYNSKYKNRETNPIIINNNKILKKAN